MAWLQDVIEILKAERMLSVGDRIDLSDEMSAAVLEMRDDRAFRIRVTRNEVAVDVPSKSAPAPDAPSTPTDGPDSA